MAERELTEQEEKDAREFVTALTKFASTYNRPAQREAIRRLVNEHRTHQQNVTRFVHTFLKHLASQRFDARNEAAVQWAKKATEDETVSFPYV